MVPNRIYRADTYLTYVPGWYNSDSRQTSVSSSIFDLLIFVDESEKTLCSTHAINRKSHNFFSFIYCNRISRSILINKCRPNATHSNLFTWHFRDGSCRFSWIVPNHLIPSLAAFWQQHAPVKQIAAIAPIYQSHRHTDIDTHTDTVEREKDESKNLISHQHPSRESHDLIFRLNGNEMEFTCSADCSSIIIFTSRLCFASRNARRCFTSPK